MEGGVCEIPVTHPMHNSAMETVEHLSVDIWCMLHWIIGFPGMSCSTSE